MMSTKRNEERESRVYEECFMNNTHKTHTKDTYIPMCRIYTVKWKVRGVLWGPNVIKSYI